MHVYRSAQRAPHLLALRKSNTRPTIETNKDTACIVVGVTHHFAYACIYTEYLCGLTVRQAGSTRKKVTVDGEKYTLEQMSLRSYYLVLMFWQKMLWRRPSPWRSCFALAQQSSMVASKFTKNCDGLNMVYMPLFEAA